MNNLADNERLYSWEDLTELQKAGVILAHGGLTNDKEKLQRLFELGKPKIVWGNKNGGKQAYCRIAVESVDVMKVILREYL